MKKMKGLHTRRIFIILLVASILISMIGCSVPDASETTKSPDKADTSEAAETAAPEQTEQESEEPKVTEVEVGYASLKSGALAAIGFYIDAAVHIALEDFNAQSDVTVTLVEEDVGSTVESANDGTVRLIDNKVPSMVAVVAPDQYTAMLQELEEAEIPFMVTAAPDIIFTYGYEWLFSAYVTKEQEHMPIISWAEDLGLTSIAILTGNDDTSKASVESITALGAEKGITVYSEYTNAGDNDYTANITSARRNEPEGYCVLTGDAEAAKILRQMRQLGIEEPLNFGGQILVQQFLDRLEADEITGLYGQASILAPSLSDDPRVAAFGEKYLAATEAPADIISMVTYDACMLIFEATAAAGGDKQGIIDYLRGLEDYDGISGIFNYDERGLGRHEAYLFQAGDDKQVELLKMLPIE